MDTKIHYIRQGLIELKAYDKNHAIFGSSNHQYLLNAVKKESEVIAFENQHGIQLPEGYRRFIIELGNGGVGPYYGLQTLEDSLCADLDYKRENKYLNPSKPFLMTEPWNMNFAGDYDNKQAYRAFEDEYFKDSWADGLLRICNYGCGVSMNLVVNGAEYGNIWVDDRVSDGGIYPDPYFGQTQRTQFLDWYILWLNISLKKIAHIAPN